MGYNIQGDQVSSGVVLLNSSMTVLDGGIAFDTIINNQGEMTVLDGGIASNTVVNSAGDLLVDSSGCAINTTVNLGGELIAYTGGIALNTQVNGGTCAVYMGYAENATIDLGGEMQVALQGMAKNVTINTGTMVVFNSAYAEDITVNSGGILGAYGNAEVSSVTVKNGGEFAINSGGLAKTTIVESAAQMHVMGQAHNTIVKAGGYLYLFNGWHTGTLTIENGATMFASTGNIVFSVNGKTSSDDYLINDISRITGTASFYIYVSENQAVGTYKLAQGASNFNQSITIYNDNGSFGRLTVNGTDYAYNGKIYSLDQNAGNLTLTISAVPPKDVDIVLYQPADWGDKLIISTDNTSSIDDTTITTQDNIFVSFAIKNAGNDDITKVFTVSLYLDGTLVRSWNSTAELQSQHYIYRSGFNLGNLSAGEHTLTLVADDGNIVAESNENNNSYSKTFTVFSLSSPSLTFEITGNPVNWTNKDVTLIATVNGGTVEFYNGTKWVAGAEQTVSVNGTYKFRVTDAAGNVTEKSVTVDKIDKVAPTLEISGNATEWTQQDVTLTATVSDGTVEYWNGTKWVCGNKLTVSDNGVYKFRVTDLAGNVTEKSVTVDKIDRIAPTLEISGNATSWTNSDVTLTASANESGTIEYWSGTQWVVGSKYTVSGNGTYKFRVTDAAGNVTTKDVKVDKIDKVAPTLEISGNPNDWTNTDVILTAAVSDGTVEFFNGSEWVAGAEQTVSANGTYKFRVTDAAGNVTEQEVVVDKINKLALDAPMLSSDMGKKLSNHPVTITASAATGVFIEYSLDKQTWYTYQDGVLAGNNGEYYFRSIDSAGNISQTNSYIVDKIDPVADLSNTDYIFIKSNFNEKTTGKKQNGITLTFGENAFASLADVGDTFGKTVIMVDSKTAGDYVDTGVVAGVAVIPTVKETDNSYSYKAASTPKGTLTITKDTGTTEFIRFATVNVNNAAVGSVAGGKESSSEDTKNTVDKKGKVTDTAKSTFSQSDSGKFTAVNGSVDVVRNYSTVTLTDSYAGTVSNFKSSDSKSDTATFDEVKNTVTRKVALSHSETTAGTLKAANSTLGNVTGFATVTLKDVEQAGDFRRVDENGNKYSTVKETLDIKTAKDGSVSGTYTKTETFTRAGKFTATGSVVGDIENFSTVTLDNSCAQAISNFEVAKVVTKDTANWDSAEEYGRPDDYDLYLDCFDLEPNTQTTPSLNGSVTLKNGASAESISNFKSVTLTGSEVGSIENVNKVTVNKGDSAIGSYTGTNGNDTFTIAKGAVLTANKLNLGEGAKDTLAINGTLILTGTEVVADKFSGKGEIAVVDSLFDDLDLEFANILNVGETAGNFRGTAYENADDTAKKAVKWDGKDTFNGWLGSWDGYKSGSDTVDYIKFTAQANDELIVDGVEDWTLLDKKGNDIGQTITAAGEYTIKLKHEEKNSIDYTIKLA